MYRFLKENSLSLVLFSLFFLMLGGLSIAGHLEYNQEMESHAGAELGYWQYIGSGNFVEAVFENWESEFLQMWALVILTIHLRQKGSADSKKLRGKEPEDTRSRYSLLHANSWRTRGLAMKDALFSRSLGLALLALFLLSISLHAWGGVVAFNHEAVLHGEAQYSLLQYVTSAQFWFESLQNWQSEFLAVGALLVLSIFLRERGSPESKPIGEPNSSTGSE